MYTEQQILDLLDEIHAQVLTKLNLSGSRAVIAKAINDVFDTFKGKCKDNDPGESSGMGAMKVGPRADNVVLSHVPHDFGDIHTTPDQASAETWLPVVYNRTDLETLQVVGTEGTVTIARGETESEEGILLEVEPNAQMPRKSFSWIDDIPMTWIYLKHVGDKTVSYPLHTDKDGKILITMPNDVFGVRWERVGDLECAISRIKEDKTIFPVRFPDKWFNPKFDGFNRNANGGLSNIFEVVRQQYENEVSSVETHMAQASAQVQFVLENVKGATLRTITQGEYAICGQGKFLEPMGVLHAYTVRAQHGGYSPKADRRGIASDAGYSRLRFEHATAHMCLICFRYYKYRIGACVCYATHEYKYVTPDRKFRLRITEHEKGTQGVLNYSKFVPYGTYKNGGVSVHVIPNRYQDA